MMETHQFVFFVLAWLLSYITIIGIGLGLAAAIRAMKEE